MEKNDVNLAVDSNAVPFGACLEAIEHMQHGSVLRVMFQMLFYTGCRKKELDLMRPYNFVDDYVFWELGKNQNNWRKKKLPVPFVKELKEYRRTHRVPSDKLFHISPETMRRYFNRDVRPFLSAVWHEKRLTLHKGVFKKQYALQLCGIRKSYQTILFARQLEKWKSGEIALEFTSKEMKHSSRHITAFHYISNFERVGVNDPLISSQKKLLNWVPCLET